MKLTDERIAEIEAACEAMNSKTTKRSFGSLRNEERALYQLMLTTIPELLAEREELVDEIEVAEQDRDTQVYLKEEGWKHKIRLKQKNNNLAAENAALREENERLREYESGFCEIDDLFEDDYPELVDRVKLLFDHAESAEKALEAVRDIFTTEHTEEECRIIDDYVGAAHEKVAGDHHCHALGAECHDSDADPVECARLQGEAIVIRKRVKRVHAILDTGKDPQ